VRPNRRFLPVALLALVQAVSVAQQERDAFREAYRMWRQADPNLERDAATSGPTVGARADKVAAGAAKYYAARKAYLDSQRVSAGQKAEAVEALPVAADFSMVPASYTMAQSTSIGNSIDAIAADPDRVIQRLRQSLERERTALAALNTALSDSQRGLDAIKRSSAAAEQARSKLMEHYQSLAGDLQQSATETTEVGTLWAGYYRTLSEASRGAAARGPALATLTAPVRAPNAAPAEAPSNAGAGNPAAVVRAPSIAGLPLYRYVGEWVYPTVGAQYHGPQPETVDLAVREENGQAKGTLVVRFQVPPGGVIEQSLRFTFEGPFQKTRNQSFPLVTSAGAKGVVELIPSSVFNLLAVTYKIDTTPARQGDFLVVKK